MFGRGKLRRAAARPLTSLDHRNKLGMMSAGEHFGDLFGHTAQPARPAPPRKEPLTAADVRLVMLGLIETARTAQSLPLGAPEWTQNIAMFPIMAQWLDPEDGAQLTLAFETEIERLRLAA